MPRLKKMPKLGEFAFRGHCQMSGGIVMGLRDTPLDRRTATKRLGDAGVDRGRLTRAIIADTCTKSGAKRVSKVLQSKPVPGGTDFPPGTGIPQAELTSKPDFVVAAVILTEGATWLTR